MYSTYRDRYGHGHKLASGEYIYIDNGQRTVFEVSTPTRGAMQLPTGCFIIRAILFTIFRLCSLGTYFLLPLYDS